MTPRSRPTPRPPAGRAARQRGVTLLVVLVLLSVMLLGALALARTGAVGTLAAGNAAAKERALQLSEIGVNDAFAAVAALADEDSDSGGWYFATARATDAAGLPQGIDLATGGSARTVDGHRIGYVVERLCDSTPVTDPRRQCLLRQTLPRIENANGLDEPPELPAGRQFRISVHVSGPQGTRRVVQVLMTRG